MSIETARIDALPRSSSWSKKACKVAALRPCLIHTSSPRGVVGDAGQVAVAAAPGDLVDADQHQSLEPLLVELVGHNPLDDPPDRLPVDAHQAGDRGLRHLLGEERHHVLEVARVAGARPRPADRLDLDAAVRAATRRSSHSMKQREPPRSRWRQRRRLVSWVARTSWPQRPQTFLRRRRRILTTTPRRSNETPVTESPGKPSIRLNVVVTRTRTLLLAH
jgi:hypothetical protein